MTCKLCNQERKLIKAHILPKFLFEKMKDENNAFLTINYDLNDFKNHRVKKVQIEDYDSKILCSDCDNRIFGRYYEDYAKIMFYGAKFPTEINPDCKNFIIPNDGSEYSICTNFDYKRTKNFLLSLLWRASVTDRKFFDEINLGAKHSERLRKILYENLETDEEEYPIIISSFIRTKNTFENSILKPFKSKNSDGLISYVFMIDGYQYIFFIKSAGHKFPTKMKKILLSKDQFFISHFKNGMELKIIENWFRLRRNH